MSGLARSQHARTVYAEQAIVAPAHRGGGVAVALFWNFYRISLEIGITVGLMVCHPRQTRYYTPFGWYRVGAATNPMNPDMPGDVLRHDTRAFGPMLRRGSPLALVLAGWRLRGSPIDARRRYDAPPCDSPEAGARDAR